MFIVLRWKYHWCWVFFPFRQGKYSLRKATRTLPQQVQTANK